MYIHHKTTDNNNLSAFSATQDTLSKAQSPFRNPFFSASHPYFILCQRLTRPSLASPSTIPLSSHQTMPLPSILSCNPVPSMGDYLHSHGSCFDVVRDKTNYSSTFRTWRRIGNGVLQTPEIQSLPNPVAVFGFSLALRTFIAAKLQKILISFCQKNLKMFLASASTQSSMG